MPTARYNKQQICGILLQFRAGLGSGGERGLLRTLCTNGLSPGGWSAGKPSAATLPSLEGFFSPHLQSENLPSPRFVGGLGYNNAEYLFYRGAICSHFFV